jgi:hypothetical protein
MESSSIRFSNERIILFFAFSFKLMEIAKCKPSLKSQCPWDWLRTQVQIVGKRQSITSKKCAKLEVEAFD